MTRWLTLPLLALAACSGGDAPGDDTDAVADTDGGDETDTTGDDLTGDSDTGDGGGDSDLPAGATGEDTDAPLDTDLATFVPADLVVTAPVRLVILGDSITAGSGASRERDDYVQLLQENDAAVWPGWDRVDLQTAFPSIVDVIDVSQGGATTDTMIRSQIPALKRRLGTLPAEGETLIVFTIGGNDAQAALVGNAAKIVDQGLENYETIVQALQDPEVFAETPEIFATNVYEPSDAVGKSRQCFLGTNYASKLPELDRFNAGIRDLGATYGFAAVDLRGHFLGHGYHHDDTSNAHYDAADPTLWFYADCIHPNDRGHHELRRLFHAAITGEPLRVDLP